MVQTGIFWKGTGALSWPGWDIRWLLQLCAPGARQALRGVCGLRDLIFNLGLVHVGKSLSSYHVCVYSHPTPWHFSKDLSVLVGTCACRLLRKASQSVLEWFWQWALHFCGCIEFFYINITFLVSYFGLCTTYLISVFGNLCANDCKF